MGSDGMFLTKIKIFLKLPTKQWKVWKFFSFHGTLFIGFQFKYSVYNLNIKVKRFACFFFEKRETHMQLKAQKTLSPRNMDDPHRRHTDKLFFFLSSMHAFTYSVLSSAISEVFKF